MPDNEPHIGSSSKSVEDLIEELNAEADVKEMFRNLDVIVTERLQRQRLKHRLEALVKSRKKIERKEVELMAEILDAPELFAVLAAQELKKKLKNELKNLTDEIKSLKKQLEKAGREKENLEASSKVPNVYPVVKSWSDKGLYWN